MVAGLAAVAAVGGAVIATAGAANATGTAPFTITKVAPTILASDMKNTVITVTGTGFDESDFPTDGSGVALSSGGTDCGTPIYIVASPTTLVIKTTTNDCDAGTGVVTLTDAAGDPAVTSAAGAFKFVDPPTLRTLDSDSDGTNDQNAVMTDATSGLPYAQQAVSLPSAGGTIRVYSGSTPFQNDTANKLPLSATLGGKSLTSVVMHTGGDYFTAKVPSGVGANPTLSVTSAGVTVSFTNADINAFTVGGATISLSSTSGPASGGGTLTITGVGTSWSSASAPSVQFGDQTIASSNVTVVSATKLTITVPAIDDPNTTGANSGPVEVTVGTGANATLQSATSVYTYLNF